AALDRPGGGRAAAGAERRDEADERCAARPADKRFARSAGGAALGNEDVEQSGGTTHTEL
ncbi:MAG: hypothetical protein M3188_02470, partial [Actinomycetota bacterium]|nr:hypothetical protein [Actinomycetota bacterium]